MGPPLKADSNCYTDDFITEYGIGVSIYERKLRKAL